MPKEIGYAFIARMWTFERNMISCMCQVWLWVGC